MLDEAFEVLWPEPGALVTNSTLRMLVRLPCCVFNEGFKLSITAKLADVPWRSWFMEIDTVDLMDHNS